MLKLMSTATFSLFYASVLCTMFNNSYFTSSKLVSGSVLTT